MAVSSSKNGLFVTFEGAEGAGKTTQMAMVAEKLQALGYQVLQTREPGGTPLGEEIRRLLMNKDGAKVSPKAELLLFGAARVQHLQEKILPHLQKGGVVLCDRFLDSTTAYQGYARKLELSFINRMHRFCLEEKWPDLTFLLQIDLAESRRRTQSRDGAVPGDRFEAENNDFHLQVQNGFLELARLDPQRFRVIDAQQPVAEVNEAIMAEVLHALDRI